MTALVVDDDPGMQRLLQAILHRDGYSVLVVDGGDNALDLLRTKVPVAVILLDLVMPRMDGRTFRREQLRDPSIAAIPTVVLTGGEVSPAVRDELGVAAIVKKPFKIPRLLEAVRAATLLRAS